MINQKMKVKKIFFIMLAIAGVGFFLFLYQIVKGLGVASVQNNVGWGIYIAHFSFWLAVAHGSMIVSTAIFLFGSRLENTVSRIAEICSVFGVAIAGLFPIIHMGKPFLFYWIMPYPNRRQLMVNFTSPLLWDVFAITGFLILAIILLYVKWIPHIADLRDQSKSKFYAFLALGWKDTDRQKAIRHQTSKFLSILGIPLAVLAHSVGAWVFGLSVIPGWHEPILAPYLVVGALVTGTAMIICLSVFARKFLGFAKHIHQDHLQKLGKILLVSSFIMGYIFIIKTYSTFIKGDKWDKFHLNFLIHGVYRPLFFSMIFFQFLLPLALFFRKVRENIFSLALISLGILMASWLDKYLIVVVPLTRDFLPYASGIYCPSFVEIGICMGGLAGFFVLFLLWMHIFPFQIKENKNVSQLKFFPSFSLITLIGIILGFAIAFALSLYHIWPLVVGGKPMLSYTSLAVLGIEAGILTAAILLFAMFLFQLFFICNLSLGKK